MHHRYVIDHPKTGKPFFRRTIPSELRPIVGRSVITRSLAGSGKAFCPKVYAELIDETDRMIADARAKLAAGESARDLTTVFRIVADWKADEAKRDHAEWLRLQLLHKDRHDALYERIGDLTLLRDQLNEPDKPVTDYFNLGLKHPLTKELERLDISMDSPLHAPVKELIRQEWLTRVNARLNGAESSASAPPATDAAPAAIAPTPVTMAQAIESWAKRSNPAPKTRYSWPRILKKLTDFLGHDDLTRIVQADVERWLDHLIDSGLAQSTVENHLIIVKTLLGHAYSRRMIHRNPVADVRFKAKTKPRAKPRGYTEEEAKLILTRAREQKEPHKLWVTWICACTGARIDEVCGAMVRDVETISGIPCLHIRPDYREEGGSVKNENSIRVVPLHPALIREGFLDYKDSLPADGPLFPNVTPDRFGKRAKLPAPR